MKRKSFKKFGAAFLSASVALTLTSGLSYTAFADTSADYDEVVAIVHTNDVHGHISVEPYVKGLADSLKASGDYSLVLTVSAGDVYGGGEAVAGYFNGELIPAIQDSVYDVIVPGNNDFGFGSQECVSHNLMLTALYKHTQTICANQIATSDIDVGAYASKYTPVSGAEYFASLYDGLSAKEDGTVDFSALNLSTVSAGESPWDTTTTFTTDKGTKVGLFGLTTNGGALAVQTTGQGSIASAKKAVASLQEEGATAIVGIGHTGWTGEGSTETSANDTNSWQIGYQVDNLDAFVDGHTHSIINNGDGVTVNGTYINQAQCFGDCIGVMYLYLKDGKVVDAEGKVISGDEISSITADPDVQAQVDEANEQILAIAGPTLATTPYFLNGERLSAENAGGTVRGNETNLGDLMTDIIRSAASEKMGVDYDFVIYPGYWLRSSIEEGAGITKIDISSVFANPTMLAYETLSASEIYSVVEKGLSKVYPESGD